MSSIPFQAHFSRLRSFEAGSEHLQPERRKYPTLVREVNYPPLSCCRLGDAT